MTAPLTLIVEGKPLVFDVPVPVGEVIPAGSWYYWKHPDGNRGLVYAAIEVETFANDLTYFTARPPVAPESFEDGDVAWVRLRRTHTATGLTIWTEPNGCTTGIIDSEMKEWCARGVAFTTTPPRPESLADVLDDANLPDELRARIEKAVGA